MRIHSTLRVRYGLIRATGRNLIAGETDDFVFKLATNRGDRRVYDSSAKVYDLSAIDIRRKRPHDSELSRDNLRTTPYEINYETCLSGRLLDSSQEAKCSENEK